MCNLFWCNKDRGVLVTASDFSVYLLHVSHLQATWLCEVCEKVSVYVNNKVISSSSLQQESLVLFIFSLSEIYFFYPVCAGQHGINKSYKQHETDDRKYYVAKPEFNKWHYKIMNDVFNADLIRETTQNLKL